MKEFNNKFNLKVTEPNDEKESKKKSDNHLIKTVLSSNKHIKVKDYQPSFSKNINNEKKPNAPPRYGKQNESRVENEWGDFVNDYSPAPYTEGAEIEDNHITHKLSKTAKLNIFLDVGNKEEKFDLERLVTNDGINQNEKKKASKTSGFDGDWIFEDSKDSIGKLNSMKLLSLK